MAVKRQSEKKSCRKPKSPPGSPSFSLKDGSGNRLYATFTRICYSLQRPLGAIAENTRLDLRGSASTSTAN
jgi:hypothetical protein